ncbi:hypothetical protein JZ751_006663 [Albula glossodonta]|uniref:Uncharacterized protein n=1 Tax=Albula glossodonta TaxID=121402 RepID=A0A8T2P9Q0_9TELE|nr:hypothetical protein JZ751_006663 [Albula glossodonta]
MAPPFPHTNGEENAQHTHRVKEKKREGGEGIKSWGYPIRQADSRDTYTGNKELVKMTYSL